MRDMEWFQCGYLPRRGDRAPDDDESACTLTSCFRRNAGEEDDETPALVRVYPGGWGFAVGSSSDGAVWTWGACRDYLAEGAPGDGRPRRGAGRAHPASAGFATVVSAETRDTARNDSPSEGIVRVEGWRPGTFPADDRAPPDAFFPAAARAIRLRWGGAPRGARRVRELAVGDGHFLACTENGEAFFCDRPASVCAALVLDADNTSSGVDVDEEERAGPRRGTSKPIEITRVAAGSRHSALVDADGRVWTFGWGLYGQLGHETCEDASSPTPVASLGACFARAVAAGAAHTSVPVSTGSVYAFGSNVDGQLGVPAAACALGAATATPALVEFPWDDEPSVSTSRANTSVAAVSCGARHTACVTTLGEMVSWGWNAYGQLGVGDLETRAAPTRVAAPALAGRKAEAVACGRWHTVVGAASGIG